MIRCLLAFAAVSCFAQPYLNLDFETSVRGGTTPWSWTIGNPANFEYSLDATTFQSGSRSIRIRNSNPFSTTIGTLYQNFPMDVAGGHHIKLTGWMKTANISGSAGYWWRVDGALSVLSIDNAPSNGGAGTTDWTQYSFERDISPDLSAIYFGTFVSGTGTAWFDNIQIEIDGAPFVPGPPPLIGELTAAQLDWINSTAIKTAGADPALPLDDLAPLKDFVGNARIVGLGEQSHGTSEFFRMKHRIIEYLASQLGFTIFSIEANMPESYAVNDYILNGKGDPKQLLKGMYFWTWNTQEVLDMIEWMRQFNQSGQGRIQFTGFDMQYSGVASQIVRDFVTKNDPGYMSELFRIYNEPAALTVTGFGLVNGSFPISAAAGKHLKYTGYIKTKDVSIGYAGLWWRVDGPNGTTLAFDNMSDRGATGTSDWQLYTIELDIPANVTNINFGALHPGNGQAWFDTLAVELDGVPYDPSPRFDFDFESASPVGFSFSSAGGRNFQVRLDGTTAHTGRQSATSSYAAAAVPSYSQVLKDLATVIDHLNSSRDTYLQQGVAAADFEWAIQNARIVYQATDDSNNPNVRDPDMASNISWIVDQAPPGARVVLWAHNYHVSRTSGAMGSYLAAKYGTDYRVLGFAFNDGKYNAINAAGKLGPNDASPSFPGSYEYVMHAATATAAGTPAPYILDLRQAMSGDPGSAWLLSESYFRDIGAVADDGFYVTYTLAHDYDGLIYVDHSTPTKLLP